MKKTWYQNKLIEYVKVCHIIYDTQEHTNSYYEVHEKLYLFTKFSHFLIIMDPL